jgi:hypothetical protein
MHPGNILLPKRDFTLGWILKSLGSLSDADKTYLVRNFVTAFWRVTIKKLPSRHLDAFGAQGIPAWMEFEGAIRAVCVCEPILTKAFET